MQCAVGEHWFYQAFEFFFYSISFVQIFWFYPYICTVLYAPPPPPHISLFKLYVLFSLLGIGGGDVNWSDLQSLFIYPPFPPPPRLYMGLLTFSHYPLPPVFRQLFSWCANFYQFFANIMQTLDISTNIFAQLSILFHVWVPSAPPLNCMWFL